MASVGKVLAPTTPVARNLSLIHIYLFLVTVADAHGLSYYADASVSRRLGLDPRRLERARRDLIGLGLIAFEPPLYQVLSLPTAPVPVATRLTHLHAIVGRHA